MGKESEHKSARPRVAQIIEDGEVLSEDRGHIIKLKNMSLQELYDMAYQAGFEDGMTFVTTPKIAHG